MIHKPLLRQVSHLALTAFLIVSLLSTSAAALPDPDEIAPEGEIEECSELTEAVNPISDEEWEDYKNCKAEEIEHNQREEIARNLSFLIDTKKGIESWFAEKADLIPIA